MAAEHRLRLNSVSAWISGASAGFGCRDLRQLGEVGVVVLSQDFAQLGLVNESLAPLKGESPR